MKEEFKTIVNQYVDNTASVITAAETLLES